MKSYDLIIKNAQIHTMDEDRKVYAKGIIGIEGEKITLIKEMNELTPEEFQECEGAGRVIDAEGKVVFPGFIDTHIHIFQSFLKGLGADHRLIEWLNLSALPYGQYMTPHQHELAAQLACMEAIKSGCTTMSEFFYTNQDPELAHSCIDGMVSTGIRSVFIRTFQDTGEEYGMPKCFLEPAGKAMKEVDALKKAYKENDMLSIWTGPDVTWSTTKEGYQEMLEYCLSENVRYSMHIKETEVDNEMCGRYYGKDIVDMLEEIGFLTDKFLAVHCVNLTPHDIERFAKYGVSISHNPAPNLYLGSGIPPIPESLAAGVNVSIGTDGAASNNSTAGGAKAIGMADKLGTLESGKNADLIIFDPNHLKSAPMHDAKATVVYASSEENIDTTIVNGKVVYQGGKFTCGIDERSLIDEINSELVVLKKQLADK